MTTLKNDSAQAGVDMPFWTNELNAETFAKIQDERLEKSQQAIDRMLAVDGRRTIDARASGRRCVDFRSSFNDGTDDGGITRGGCD